MALNCRPDTISFHVFTLRPTTGELWKNGTKLKLQGKPRLILQALLRKPGEVVTREELRKILWVEGTFVDYESGLNTAMNRLRATLGDSADRPLYIETLPRLGYRFIWPVDKPSAALPLALPRRNSRVLFLLAAFAFAASLLFWNEVGEHALLAWPSSPIGFSLAHVSHHRVSARGGTSDRT